MNQTQLKYARERASSIYRARKEALVEKYTTPAVRLTDDEKLQALKDGTFKTGAKGSRDTWHWRVTFNAEREKVFKKEPHDAALAVLETAYRALVDELVLGSNEEALKLLKAFEAAA